MTQKTAIIIHGWGGNPNVGWFTWIDKELTKKGYKVFRPIMPNPDTPKIKTWVATLKSFEKNIDENTILIGHSIGCQTIMRYLEQTKKTVGKVIFVAPWLTLTNAVTDSTEDYKIAKPWLKTPIDFKKVQSHMNSSTAIFSDNDPFVSITNAQAFKTKLGSKIIIQKKKEHFEEGKTGKIPALLKEVKYHS